MELANIGEVMNARWITIYLTRYPVCLLKSSKGSVSQSNQNVTFNEIYTFLQNNMFFNKKGSGT